MLELEITRESWNNLDYVRLRDRGNSEDIDSLDYVMDRDNQVIERYFKSYRK